MAGESEEQQALALLQKEMLAFILEGVTARIERGDAPALADAVAASIGRQVEDAIERGLNRFDLPTAKRIAEEAVCATRSAPEPRSPVLNPLSASPSDDAIVEGSEPVPDSSWRRMASPLWLVAPLLLLLGITGWLLWQKSAELQQQSEAKSKAIAERGALRAALCQSAITRQQEVARLRNTPLYKNNCPDAPAILPEFCQAVDALASTAGAGSGCGRP